MEAIRIQHQAFLKLDDLVIVQRILSGEKNLFEILLRRYNQTLYRVIRSYLSEEEEVQDAMQNAYLKAFDKLYQFHGSAAFSTWLIRIGINEALQRLKERKKEKILYLHTGEISPDTVQRIVDKQLNPEKVIIRKEAQQLLEHAIDSLPEKYKIIYVLKEVEGIDTHAISESLGLTESNVKVRLHRAKKLLKDSLYQFSMAGEVLIFGSTRCDAVVNAVMNAI